MNHSLAAFEQALKSSRTTLQLDTVLQQHLAKFNITTYSFTYYSYHLNSLNKLKYDVASPNFKIWHEHYLEQHYEEIDSTMEKVHRTNLPLFWDLQQQLKEATSEKEKQMRLDSIHFGAEKGLSIPIHGPGGDFANFLVVQMRNENCLDHWEELQYELLLTGYYYYSYLQLILIKTQPCVEKSQLNKREMQCLVLTSQRHSVSAIASKLNITERTVNYHIQRMNKKLGVKNKHQSVIRALQQALIT